MGSDASYNERRLLWAAVRLVWAVTGMRRTPRPVGANCTRVQPARRVKPAFMPRPASTAGAEVSMGSDTLYNEQALLWGVVRFVWGVTCMRRPPRRRRELHAGSACGAAWVQAQPAAGNFKGRGKKSAFGRQKGGRGGGRRLILDLDNTIRQGRGGYFDHTAHQAVRRRI